MHKEYQIYPRVQGIKYLESTFELDKNINIIVDSDIDSYTRDKAKSIFEKRGYVIDQSDATKEGSTNLLLRLKDEDKHLTSRYLEDFNYENFDAYQISIKNKMIIIRGKDSDAVFYGLVTLSHILDQIEDSKIEELTINDYADQKIRGIIEGYYGIPWGNANRKDLLEFGGRFKNNAFVFAPKDDPYHRERWKDLYPQAELDEIAYLAEIGNKNKNRFIWTITPFKTNPITDDNIEESLVYLKEKFDQLYDAGVRQFGILGDDVGILPYETVIKVINEMVDWTRSKDEKVYDLIFVPQNYTLQDWGNRELELSSYEKGFDPSVQIAFTGYQVLAPVDQESIDKFKKGIEGIELRDPLFWLNWPVNDIDRKSSRRLFMGKGSMLEKNVTGISGVLTNPMEEAHANYPAIFAIADYTWNSKAFDCDKSWEDSFKYIDKNASEELNTIAMHMSSMDEFEDIEAGQGVPGLEESEDLNKLAQEFFDLSVVDKNFEIKAKDLKKEFLLIANAVDGFLIQSANDKLKEDLSPYILGLKEKSQAAAGYLEAIILKSAGTSDESLVLEKIKEADKLLKLSQSHYVETKTSEFPSMKLIAQSGSKYINKIIARLKELSKE